MFIAFWIYNIKWLLCLFVCHKMLACLNRVCMFEHSKSLLVCLNMAFVWSNIVKVASHLNYPKGEQRPAKPVNLRVLYKLLYLYTALFKELANGRKPKILIESFVKFSWGNSLDGNFWGFFLSLNKIDCPDNLKMRLGPIFDCLLWKFIMQSNSSAFPRCWGLKICCPEPKIKPDPLSCFSWFWQSSIHSVFFAPRFISLH